MNPTIDVRIDSMIRALTEVVLPDLPPGGASAEQATLVLGHLHVLRAQADLAGPFEDFELRHVVAEARALLGVLDDSAAASAGDGVRAAIEEADDRSPDRVRDSAERVRAAVERLLHVVARDGDPTVVAQVQSTVLRFESVLAAAHRALFAGNGWESPDTVLPDLPSLVRRV